MSASFACRISLSIATLPCGGGDCDWLAAAGALLDATCAGGALVWIGTFAETLGMVAVGGATLVADETTGDVPADGFLPNQNTAAISTATMAMNQKMERRIFMGCLC
jgi:hypothetical protein